MNTNIQIANMRFGKNVFAAALQTRSGRKYSLRQRCKYHFWKNPFCNNVANTILVKFLFAVTLQTLFWANSYLWQRCKDVFGEFLICGNAADIFMRFRFAATPQTYPPAYNNLHHINSYLLKFYAYE